LKKLPGFIARRKEIATMYDEGLGDLSWLQIPPALQPYVEGSYYMYHIQVYGEERDDLAKYLRDNDIYTTFRYYPLHWVKAYGCKENFENAEWAANHTLCLPIHHSLKDDEVRYIIEKIREYK
jgi:aminotransferase